MFLETREDIKLWIHERAPYFRDRPGSRLTLRGLKEDMLLWATVVIAYAIGLDNCMFTHKETENGFEITIVRPEL